jgi:hypothetical protein
MDDVERFEATDWNDIHVSTCAIHSPYKSYRVPVLVVASGEDVPKHQEPEVSALVKYSRTRGGEIPRDS